MGPVKKGAPLVKEVAPPQRVIPAKDHCEVLGKRSKTLRGGGPGQEVQGLKRRFWTRGP